MLQDRGALVVTVLLVVWANAPRSAYADELPQPSPLSLTLQGGYRYIHSGLDELDAEAGRFNGAVDGTVTMHAGDARRGFYGAGHFDLYVPDGRSGSTYAVDVRAGLFHHVQHFDDGYRTFVNGSTQCYSALGICSSRYTATTRRTAPPRWWRSIEYYWLGYRLVGGLPVRTTSRGGITPEIAHALTGGAGVTTPGRGLARGHFEVDLQRYFNTVAGQNEWGVRFRGAVSAGPVYLEGTALFDDVIGGELAIGVGFILRTN